MSAITSGKTTTVSTTVGTSAAAALAEAPNKVRNFLQIVNTDDTGKLAFTLDGTDPVVNGNGVTLVAYGSATYDVFVPTGPVRVIGNEATTSYTINYMN